MNCINVIFFSYSKVLILVTKLWIIFDKFFKYNHVYFWSNIDRKIWIFINWISFVRLYDTFITHNISCELNKIYKIIKIKYTKRDIDKKEIIIPIKKISCFFRGQKWYNDTNGFITLFKVLYPLYFSIKFFKKRLWFINILKPTSAWKIGMFLINCKNII